MRLFVCIENGKNGINTNGEAWRTMGLTLIEIVAITAGGLWQNHEMPDRIVPALLHTRGAEYIIIYKFVHKVIRNKINIKNNKKHIFTLYFKMINSNKIWIAFITEIPWIVFSSVLLPHLWCKILKQKQLRWSHLTIDYQQNSVKTVNISK